MLTPPYHFSIIASPPHLLQAQAAPQPQSQRNKSGPQILYRGSVPAQRNLSFLRRLGLRTLIYLKKKELKDDADQGGGDDLVKWAKKRGVRLKWVKAEGMGEEKLGMGKNEVNEVLKTILDPSAYPLYIADIDGISHTTLVVACLRKLQGWHIDSIINEICRCIEMQDQILTGVLALLRCDSAILQWDSFEPDHDDLPLVSFISSYLSSQSSSSSSTTNPSGGAPSSLSSNTNPGSGSGSGSDGSLVLPSPPYPTWLWPTPTPTPTPAPALSQNQAQGQALSQPPGAVSMPAVGGSGSSSSGHSQGQASAPTKTRDRDRDRDRDLSTTQSMSTATSSAATGTSSPILPFPHPLNARRHPTMKLTFPMLPPPIPPSTSTSASTSVGTTTNAAQLPTSPSSASPILSPSLGSVSGPGLGTGSVSVGQGGLRQGGLSRVSSRRDKSSLPPSAASPVLGPASSSSMNSGASAKAGNYTGKTKKEEGGGGGTSTLGDAVSAISVGLTGMAHVLIGSGSGSGSGSDPVGQKGGAADYPATRHQSEISRSNSGDANNTNAGVQSSTTTANAALDRTATDSAMAGSTNKLSRQVSFHSASERIAERSPPSRQHSLPDRDRASESSYTVLSGDAAAAAAGMTVSSSPNSSSPLKKGHMISREPTISSYYSSSASASASGGPMTTSPGSTQDYLPDDGGEGAIPSPSGAVHGQRVTAPYADVNAGEDGEQQIGTPAGTMADYSGEGEGEGEEEVAGEDVDEDEEDEDDEDEDEEEDDEDDDEDGDQPTSQYISALDLAGFG
ncbi:hypothetical protein I317_03241 [Kwoniella heveanensis CBS 569]|nr:hypothetical protein I317_03241 [Kwoniella heveanensis CBS 569]